MMGGSWNRSPNRSIFIPPNGLLESLFFLRDISIISSISALTMDISSIIMNWICLYVSNFFLFVVMDILDGLMGPGSRLKKECIV